MLEYEHKHWSSGKNYLAGIDEAGRGPLAGPVVSAAVILPQGIEITPGSDQSLSDMILGGDVDCGLTALPPKPIREGRVIFLSVCHSFRGIFDDSLRTTNVVRTKLCAKLINTEQLVDLARQAICEGIDLGSVYVGITIRGLGWGGLGTLPLL